MNTVGTIDRHQHENRNRGGEHFSPLLKSLDLGNSFHASERHIQRDDDTDQNHPAPMWQAVENRSQRGAVPLHLWHDVNTETAQGARNKGQEEKITAGITNRIPQGIVTQTHDHSGHTRRHELRENIIGSGRAIIKY